MVGVGMVAFFASKKGYLLLFAFMGAMIISAVIGYLGLHFVYVEEGILLSIAGIFALIGFANRISFNVIIAVIALFGMFHGFAHGAEFQAGSFASYMAGFSLSTLGLHLSGIFLAYSFNRYITSRQTQNAVREIA